MSRLAPGWSKITRGDIHAAVKAEAVRLLGDRRQVIGIEQHGEGAQRERVFGEQRCGDGGHCRVPAAGRTLLDPGGEGPDPPTGG